MTNLKVPHLDLAPPLGVTHWNFAEIFGINKLDSLSYRMALFAFYHLRRTPTCVRRTDTHIYRASIASRGKWQTTSGSRSFSEHVAMLWNSLPGDRADFISLHKFRTSLITIDPLSLVRWSPVFRWCYYVYDQGLRVRILRFFQKSKNTTFYVF